MANSPFKYEEDGIYYPPENSVPSTYTGEGSNYTVNTPTPIAREQQTITSLPTIGVQQIATPNFTDTFQPTRAFMGNMPTVSGSKMPFAGRLDMLGGQIGAGLGKFFGGMGAGKDGGLSGSQQMGLIGGVAGIAQGLIGRKKRRNAQRKARAEYKRRRSEYENLDTSNLAAGFRNSYQGMENAFEDMTVNQQQASFLAQQNSQNQANLMQNLQGAAGSSGIAGLAQVLANQSQLATQKASASIGLQESQNQKLRAQGAQQIQQLEAAGDQFAQTQRLAGAKDARGLQYDKTGTLLGMAQADKAAADQAIQESNAALFGGIGSIAGAALTGGVNSLLKPPTGGN